MGFTVPNFNLSCHIWRDAAPPPGPPAVTSPCNLAWGRRVSLALAPLGTLIGAVLTLLLPPGTDIQCVQSQLAGDVVEVPAGSGCFYAVFGVGDIGKGFANEHRAALVVATSAFGNWPTPYP
jgi:hypothetical protein